MSISLISPPADTPANLLHLWQEAMLLNPWRYNQVTGTDAPLNDSCPVYVQPDRDRVARALYEAYSKLSGRLGYSLQPTYHTDLIPFGRGTPMALQNLRTKWKQIKAIGARATSAISASAAVVYSNSSPGFLTNDDTATITVPTTVTDVSEIQVFFRQADSLSPIAADPRWQITPLTVTIVGANAVITGHRSLFVQPAIWRVPYIDVNKKTRNEALTQDAADFVTLVDVYRVYPDATNAVTLRSDPIFSQCVGLNTPLTQAGVAFIEDNYYGIFRVRLDDVCYRYFPEYIQLNYLAGADWQYQQMDSELASALVHLANTLMPQIPDDLCDQTLVSFAEDINVSYTRVSGGGGYQTAEECPFGVQIGAQKAWKIVLNRMIALGGSINR